MKKIWYIRCPHCSKEIPVEIVSEAEAIPQIKYDEIPELVGKKDD